MFRRLFRKAAVEPDKRLGWDEVAVLLKAADLEPEGVLTQAKQTADRDAARGLELTERASTTEQAAQEAYHKALEAANAGLEKGEMEAQGLRIGAEFATRASETISGILSRISA